MKYLVACADNRYYTSYDEAAKAAAKHVVNYRQDAYILKAVAKALEPTPSIEIQVIEDAAPAA